LKRTTEAFVRAAALLLIALALGCASVIEPQPGPLESGPFEHGNLDRVQERFVDDFGRVDYGGLARDREALDRYYRRLAAVSPASHPEFFPTPEDELAYWINAYNAAVLVAVLAYYPIDSVGDVKAPLVVRPFLFGKSRLAGFFYFQQVRLGGKKMNLYDLENKIIRAYGEPRIHFAINCASVGCPFLPRRAFHPETLDDDLDRETLRFFASPEKLRIDHEARIIWLSAILDWFREDFGGSLIGYVRCYVTPERQAELDRAADYEVRFMEYDWGLNRQ
jgi:hypothetical protein